MKNSIKRAQSQARLSFAERENFRPKVKQLKKTILTLVALLAVTTGAWAQGYNVTFGGFAESEMNTTVNVTSLPYTFTAIGDDAFYPWTVISTSGNIFYNATVTSGGEGKVSANIANYDEMTITITGPFEGTATIHVTGEDDENRSISTDITVTCVAVGGTAPALTVDWNKASKTGTFTMPGGNVVVVPEFYDEAAFAVDKTGETPVTLAPKANNSAKANTDDPLVEGGTVANIVEAMEVLDAKQGKLLYHVSTTELTNDQLEALNPEDDWSETVPTADGFTFETATNVYVYYYIQGADNVQGNAADSKFTFSDTEIQMLTVNVQPEPTYTVEFAEGVNPAEPADPEWTANPAADVKKGTTVTVTYSGSKKIIGVKAEKKGGAAGKTVDLSTYTGDFYEVTEDVTFTGTTNNEISILYKGEGYKVTLDNVNAPKCFIAAWDDNYTVNIKLKGTSRLKGIWDQNADIIIGEAAAGGTVILEGVSPLGGPGATITINGGTVKAKTSFYFALDTALEVNGGAVYIEAEEGYAAVAGYASGSVTLYGWNGSAWVTYTNQRYATTDNSKAPSEWTW